MRAKGISSFIKKPAQNREKSTNGDYYHTHTHTHTGSLIPMFVGHILTLS